MNVTFNFEEAMFSIEQEIAKIPKTLKSESKTVMSNASKIVKKNVETELARHKSDIDRNTSNYDGTVPYKHMKDDVKVSVRDDKEGSVFAIIRGGKHTGYKWHLVNNGTTRTRATHFIDNALKQSEGEIDSLIDRLIDKAVQDGR